MRTVNPAWRMRWIRTWRLRSSLIENTSRVTAPRLPIPMRPMAFKSRI